MTRAVGPVSNLIAEKDFAKWLRDAFRMFGWRFAHFRPAINVRGRWMTAIEGDSGFYDYVAIRPPRLLLVEAKKGGWVPSDVPEDERAWLAAGRSIPGVECYLWGPEMRDEILLCLALDQSPDSMAEVVRRMRELAAPPLPGAGRRG